MKRRHKESTFGLYSRALDHALLDQEDCEIELRNLDDTPFMALSAQQRKILWAAATQVAMAPFFSRLKLGKKYEREMPPDLAAEYLALVVFSRPEFSQLILPFEQVTHLLLNMASHVQIEDDLGWT